MRSGMILGWVLLGVTVVGAETVRTQNAGLRYQVPKAWARVPAPSDVRAAQFRVPRAEGDTEDAEMVLFSYPAGKRPPSNEQFDAWIALFEKPGGGSAKELSIMTMRKVGSLSTTSIDLSATYKGGPGETGEGKGAPKSGWRMLAAVVEAGGSGPWYWRMIGPAKTVEGAKGAFEALLSSVEAHQ